MRMPVPDFQSLMLPVLQALSDGEETSLSRVRERVAAAVGVTSEDQKELLPSGRQSKFVNRVSWAVLYLGRAGLTEGVRRGVWRLTAEGKDLLAHPPSRVDLGYLRKYPAYVAWRTGTTKPSPDVSVETSLPEDSADTPEEAVEKAVRELRVSLEADVLDRVRQASPSFLEQVAIDLLGRMGYGRGDPDMARVTGGPGDGGVDGKIWEDVLGLDEVFVQAKRYADGNAVPKKDVTEFLGALAARGVTKGVFVTTSEFTRGAQQVVSMSHHRIALIDGKELARLMVEHDIGARTQHTYKVKRIDGDYFGLDEM